MQRTGYTVCKENVKVQDMEQLDGLSVRHLCLTKLHLICAFDVGFSIGLVLYESFLSLYLPNEANISLHLY